MRRIQHLEQLVRDGQYVVDEQLVAEAILVRARARILAPEVRFRNEVHGDARVRSFRPSTQARSFRPCRVGARGQLVSGGRR